MGRGRRALTAGLAAGLLVLGTGPPAAARELAAPVQDFVEVELATVGIATRGGVPAALLRVPGSSEVIPIFISRTQARAILLGLRGETLPRPMTHDLMGDVIEGLDARLERVYVDDLVDETFLGMLELRVAGRDGPVRIDSRPSDAIALALRVGASIHIAPDVLEAAGRIPYRGLEDGQVVTAVGITVMTPTPELREALGLPDREGLVVTRAIGPAAEAGLREGALILAVNGEQPASPMDFLNRVRRTPGDERVRIRYWYDGSTATIDLPTDVPERTPGGGARGQDITL